MASKKTDAEEPVSAPDEVESAVAVEPVAPVSTGEQGIVSAAGDFTILVKESGAVEISPRPWEGPAGLVTRKERISDLIAALQQIQ